MLSAGQTADDLLDQAIHPRHRLLQRHRAHLRAGPGRRDWLVIASARKSEDVSRLKEQGLTAVRLDLDDPESIANALAQTLDITGGRLDALFNNGAYGQPGAVEDLSRDVLRAQLETNLLGWHDLTCRVIPIMRRQGHGRIVQNSSILGLIPLPFRGAYVASKYALEGLTDTLRLELRGSGISVSLIEPGPILSRFRENAYAALKANIDTEHSVHHEPTRVPSSDSPRQAPLSPSRSRPRPC
jgi:NAD(P)-dependent dehydrogenase (short-subunit alcohol dehydrogenase family)